MPRHDQDTGLAVREDVWSVELALAGAIRDFADTVAPEDESTVRLALEAAIDAYSRGASVSEAHERARSLVQSRLRHPSCG